MWLLCLPSVFICFLAFHEFIYYITVYLKINSAIISPPPSIFVAERVRDVSIKPVIGGLVRGSSVRWLETVHLKWEACIGAEL